jgi:hypothetical protein
MWQVVINFQASSQKCNFSSFHGHLLKPAMTIIKSAFRYVHTLNRSLTIRLKSKIDILKVQHRKNIIDAYTQSFNFLSPCY